MSDLSNHASGGSGTSGSSNSTNGGSLANGSSHGNGNNASSNSTLAYSKKQRRFGMRSFLHYEYPLFYLMAVILDFLLRTTWMLKLVSNIQIEEFEGGVFTMECLEVLRRWIWVLFRMESEMVKRAGYMDTFSTPLSAGLTGGIGGDVSMVENGMENSDTIMMEDMESWQK